MQSVTENKKFTSTKVNSDIPNYAHPYTHIADIGLILRLWHIKLMVG